MQVFCCALLLLSIFALMDWLCSFSNPMSQSNGKFPEAHTRNIKDVSNNEEHSSMTQLKTKTTCVQNNTQITNL
jgi:hypothetical protein